MAMNKNNSLRVEESRKEIYWKNIPPEELTWSEAMLEIEGLVNEEVSKLEEKN